MDERAMHHQAFFHQVPPPHSQQSIPYPSQSPYQPQPTPYEIFAKPPQPLNMMNSGQDVYSTNQTGPGILGAFTDSNGQVDFDKAMATINQLASTYHQISPIVKQFSSLLRGFR